MHIFIYEFTTETIYENPQRYTNQCLSNFEVVRLVVEIMVERSCHLFKRLRLCRIFRQHTKKLITVQ